MKRSVVGVAVAMVVGLFVGSVMAPPPLEAQVFGGGPSYEVYTHTPCNDAQILQMLNAQGVEVSKTNEYVWRYDNAEGDPICSWFIRSEFGPSANAKLREVYDRLIRTVDIRPAPTPAQKPRQ